MSGLQPTAAPAPNVNQAMAGQTQNSLGLKTQTPLTRACSRHPVVPDTIWIMLCTFNSPPTSISSHRLSIRRYSSTRGLWRKKQRKSKSSGASVWRSCPARGTPPVAIKTSITRRSRYQLLGVSSSLNSRWKHATTGGTSWERSAERAMYVDQAVRGINLWSGVNTVRHAAQT
jgi:hypothetical protein